MATERFWLSAKRAMRVGVFLVCAAWSLAFRSAVAEVRTVYVPLYRDRTTPLQDLLSYVDFYVPHGGTSALIEVPRVWGDAFRNDRSYCDANQPRIVPARGDGNGLFGCAGYSGEGKTSFGFAEVLVSPDEAVYANLYFSVSRIISDGGPVDGGVAVNILKQVVQLPVYSSVFPPLALAVSSPVYLGRFQDSPPGESPVAYIHPRRVHVMLLNAGDSEAAFEVRVMPIMSGPALGVSHLTVGAGSVVYVRDIPYQKIGSGSYYPYGNAAIVEVTSPQPFLGFVLTEIDDPEVADAKYAAYPLTVYPEGPRGIPPVDTGGIPGPIKRH